MSTVTEYLSDRQIDFRTIEHRGTITAEAEARAVGVPPGSVAKTLVLDTRQGHALAVIPASRRIDLDRAAAAAREPYVHLATEREIERDLPRYELGAIPPLAGLLGLPVFVDTEIAALDDIVFAAGSRTESVLMPTAHLLDDPRAEVFRLCAPPSDLDEDRME